MEDKTKRVQIDIYDADGVLTETVEEEYDFHGLMNELSRIIVGDCVPVVRDEKQLPEKKILTNEVQPYMSVGWRLNGVEFNASGSPEDVKHQELLFRSVLEDLIATTQKVTEGELNKLNDMFNKLMGK